MLQLCVTDLTVSERNGVRAEDGNSVANHPLIYRVGGLTPSLIKEFLVRWVFLFFVTATTKSFFLSSVYMYMYRVFIKYSVFPWNVVIFLNSASSAAAPAFELCHCVHTLTPRENREWPESGIYFKIFEKTQYFMNTLYIIYLFHNQFILAGEHLYYRHIPSYSA